MSASISDERERIFYRSVEHISSVVAQQDLVQIGILLKTSDATCEHLRENTGGGVEKEKVFSK